MPDKKLPTDVERRFNKKFPGENAPLRHVGKFYGASLFVSEGIESSVMIDREEARQFLADELEKARAESAKEERERIKSALNPDLDKLQYIGKACADWHEACEELGLEVVWQDIGDEVMGQRQRPIQAITHSPLKAYHELIRASHKVVKD